MAEQTQAEQAGRQAGASLWQEAFEHAAGVAELHFGSLTVEVRVRALDTSAALEAGLLFVELQRLVASLREPDPEDETALEAADRAAADAPSAEEAVRLTVAWVERALPVALAHADQVRDLDTGEWLPLRWTDDSSEAQRLEEQGLRCLPAALLTQPDLGTILAAGLRPAREVAGKLRPFRREPGAV